MESLSVICGLTGAWLLVAGSIYQAALELKEERLEQEHIDRTRQQVSHTETSAWWWLLPPVKIYLERKRSKAYRQAFIKALPDESVEALISLINKASGWLFVAGGSWLLALKETYEFTVLHGFKTIWFWAIIIVLSVSSVANTAYRSARSERVVNNAKS